MRLRAALTIAVLLIWTAAAWPADARADDPTPTLTVSSCVAGFDDGSGWQSFGNDFASQNLCVFGQGLQIESRGEIPAGFGGFRMSFASAVSLVGMSFDIAGGDTSDGVRYEVSSCDGCAPDLTIADRNPGDPPTTITIDDLAGDEPMIQAVCTDDDGCDPGISVIFDNFQFAVQDVDVPTIAGVVNGAALTEGFLGWTNQRGVPMDITFSDTGFGLQSGQLVAGGEQQSVMSWNWLGYCASPMAMTTDSDVCPLTQHVMQLLDTNDLPEGINPLIVDGYDLVGNRATAGATLGIDRTPPDPPRGLTSSRGGGIWSANPAVDASWDPPANPIDDQRESPIVAARVSLRKVDAAASTSFVRPVAQTQSGPLMLSSDGLWRIAVAWIDSAGNTGGTAGVDVGYDGDAPAAPSSNVPGWINASDLLDGRRVEWTAPPADPNLESGICRYVASVDSTPQGTPSLTTDESVTGTSWRLPANLPDGTNYLHVRAVSCAGIGSPASSTPLSIDTTPPETTVTGLPAAGTWTRSQLTASIDATDQTSGVDSVRVSVNGGAAQDIADDHAGVTLPEGMAKLRVSAVDRAGNRGATTTYDAWRDTSAPEVDIEPLDPAAPTSVVAHARDAVSGLAAARLEIRRVDAGASASERAWSPLGPAPPLTLGDRGAAILRAQILDTEMPTGDYEIRVAASDVAGNTTARSDTALRAIHLPLRKPTRISALVAHARSVCRTSRGHRCRSVARCSKRQRCRRVQKINRGAARRSDVVRHGTSMALIGQALDDAGRPLAATRVRVTATVLDHDEVEVGTAATDALGRYSIRIPAGPTRKLTASIAGSASLQPASATARLGTRPRIEISASPRVLRSGRTLRLSGRVREKAWLPAGGLIVEFEYLTPFGWWRTGPLLRTDAKGRFGYDLPWPKIARPTSALFRAEVPTAADWPFAEGASKGLRVHVRAAR